MVPQGKDLQDHPALLRDGGWSLAVSGCPEYLQVLVKVARPYFKGDLPSLMMTLFLQDQKCLATDGLFEVVAI